SNCWVNGGAPKSGLGLPLVGTLAAVCNPGGRTLLTPGSLKVPVTPPTKAPSLAGASVARKSLAKFSPMKGPVNADGSPARGGPKKSSGAAETGDVPNNP